MVRKFFPFLFILFSTYSLASPAEERNEDLLDRILQSETKKELGESFLYYVHSIADYEGKELDIRVLKGLEVLTTQTQAKDPELNTEIHPALKKIYKLYKNKDALTEYWNLLTYLLARDQYQAEVTHPSVYLILGETYYLNGYYRSSAEALKQFAKDADPKDFRPGAYLNGLSIIGLSYSEIGNLELSEMYFNRAYEQAELLESNIWMGIIRGNMSKVFLQKGDTTTARKYIIEDLRTSRKEKVRGSIINAYIGLGNIYLNQGQLSKAINYSDSVQYYLDDLKFSNKRLNFSRLSHYKFQSSLFATQGDYYSAFVYEQKHDSLKNFIQRSRIPEKNIEEFQLINTRTKNLEIALLQTKLENEELQSQLLTWSIVALSVLIGIMVLLFWQRSSMLKKVKEHNQVIRQVQSEVVQKNKEVLLQKKKLEAANAYKDKLFSIISHDLRSPLVALKEFMSMMEQGEFSKDEVYDLLPHISKNINSLYSNSEQLLSWSRNKIKGIEVRAEVFPIVKVIQESIGMMDGLAKNKNVTFETEVSPSHLSVYADLTHLNVVLRNLIGNAVKFSFPNGVVTINVFGSGNEEFTHIQVIDKGSGMTEDQLYKLRNNLPFESEEGTNKETGTGLGLSISQQFLSANKGELKVESERGKGTTVEIILPSMNIPDKRESENFLN